MTGVVKNITDYGAFVDLGGIDGLLHITDMSYGRIKHPSEMFEVGQSGRGQGPQVRPRQPARQPRLQADPPRSVGGGRVQVPRRRHRPRQGRLDPRLRRLRGARGRHRGPGPHLRDDLEQARQAPVQARQPRRHRRGQGLGMDVENKRISLGMRSSRRTPGTSSRSSTPSAAIVQGKVRNITDFGIFVGIEEGIDGLVHISDLSWGQRIRTPPRSSRRATTSRPACSTSTRTNERFSSASSSSPRTPGTPCRPLLPGPGRRGHGRPPRRLRRVRRARGGRRGPRPRVRARHRGRRVADPVPGRSQDQRRDHPHRQPRPPHLALGARRRSGPTAIPRATCGVAA
jgi:predicted RNA-binding protein with RPS1 domain